MGDVPVDMNDLLQRMQDHAMGQALFHMIFEQYQEESSCAHFPALEQEYAQTKADLISGLDHKILSRLERAEELCEESMQWLMRFSIQCGLFTGFGQYFSETVPERPFQRLVQDQALQMPNMARFPVYCQKRTEARQAFEELQRNSAPEMAEHAANLELIWQARHLGAARHAFYLGYRGALSVLDELQPEKGSRSMLKRILMTEYELGLTLPVSERETRRRQMP